MAMGPEEVIDRINAAFGKATGHRTLHAKGRFYDATFTATPEATALTTAEHLNGQPCPVVLRWSNGGGNPKVPDTAPGVQVPAKRVGQGFLSAPGAVRSAVTVPSGLAVPGRDQVASVGTNRAWPSCICRDARPGLQAFSKQTVPEVGQLVRDLRQMSDSLNNVAQRLDQGGVTSILGPAKLPDYKRGKK